MEEQDKAHGADEDSEDSMSGSDSLSDVSEYDPNSDINKVSSSDEISDFLMDEEGGSNKRNGNAKELSTDDSQNLASHPASSFASEDFLEVNTTTDPEPVESGSNCDDAVSVESEGNRQPRKRKRSPSHGGKTRKRIRNPSKWKQNVRKSLRQSGNEYVTSKGKLFPARQPGKKKDCGGKCKFKCSTKISVLERQCIFDAFWKLCDQEKKHFFGKTALREVKKRKRTDKETSRRKYSFSYCFFLEDKKHRVCKEYYLSTLDISASRINYHHAHKDSLADTPVQSKWGKHSKKVTSEEAKQRIRNHINSFPRIESHYCRATTKKEYLEGTLSLLKMYDLYVEGCKKDGVHYVKEHLYRLIFNTEFNISFHKRKKDKCDVCAEFENIANPGPLDKAKHEKHVQSKMKTREEKQKDKEIKSKKVALISFDLENVLSLPRADVSNFFYKRKLNVYNMTGHCTIDGETKGYCSIWHECQSGRAGNDMASALIRILEEVIERNLAVDHIILWSDSCVPQNRNSHMSTALREFLIKHPSVKKIDHKYCEPGHSSIQECDNLHSQIERALQPAEVYSPLGLMRVLKKVNRHNPLVLIRMRNESFKNYGVASKFFNYSQVPYTAVKQLSYNTEHKNRLVYWTCFSKPSKEVALQKTLATTRRRIILPTETLAQYIFAKPISKTTMLSKETKNDIKTMYKYMPVVDRQFMQTLCGK